MKALFHVSLTSGLWITIGMTSRAAVHSWSGAPHGAEGQTIVFVTEEELANYSLTPADIPLVPHVVRAMRA